jgi:hypothetical protein
MPLEETVDNLDNVDEKYHEIYVENADGKFEVSTGLRPALKKERDLKKAALQELKTVKKTLDGAKSTDDMVLELKEQVATRDAKLLDFTLTSELKQAALTAGIAKDCIDDVVAITKRKFQITDEGVKVLDVDGNLTSSTPSTFFGGTFKKSSPRFYDGDKMEGTGILPHSGPGKPQTHDAIMSKAFADGDAKTLIQLETKKLNK